MIKVKFVLLSLLLAIVLLLPAPFSTNSISAQEDQIWFSLPATLETITADNADKIQQLAKLGDGWFGKVAVSSNGKTIAVAGSQGVRLFDAQDLSHERLLAGHAAWVEDMVFSPDGARIATRTGSEQDMTVRIWDVATGEQLFVLEHPRSASKYRPIWRATDNVEMLSYSPDGKMLVTGINILADTTRSVFVWDTQTGKQLKVLSGADALPGNAFSADSTMLVTGDSEDTSKLVIWELPSGRRVRTLSGHSDYLQAASFSPVGNILASADSTTIHLWDAATGKSLATLKGHGSDDYIISLLFSADGKKLATCSTDSTVRLWEVPSGKALATLDVYSPVALSFSPDGSTIATGSSGAGADVLLWDTTSGKQLHQLTGHTGYVEGLAFSGDGKWLASAGGSSVRQWDAQTGELIATSRQFNSFGRNAAFSSDNSTLAVLPSDAENSIMLIDLNTGKTRLKLSGHTDAINDIAFSPDGKTILSGSADSTVRLWDALTGQEIRTFIGHSASVSEVAFSPDGNLVATESYDDTVRIWEVASGKEVFQIKGDINATAFSPDSKLVATSIQNTISIYDLSTKKVIATLKSADEKTDFGSQSSGYIVSLTFNPDGTQLFAGAGLSFQNSTLQKLVEVWTIKNKSAKQFKTEHQDAVWSLALNGAGTLLLTGDLDSLATLFDAASGKILKQLNGHTASVYRTGIRSDDKVLFSSAGGMIYLWGIAQ